MTKIVVTGSRLWTSRKLIRNALLCYPKDSTLIHGAARGADSIAADIASHMGMTVIPFPANWYEHKNCNCNTKMKWCPMAGPNRNSDMLDQEPDVVLAFWSEKSHKGTDNCIEQARERNIPVVIIKEEK